MAAARDRAQRPVSSLILTPAAAPLRRAQPRTCHGRRRRRPKSPTLGFFLHLAGISTAAPPPPPHNLCSGMTHAPRLTRPAPTRAAAVVCQACMPAGHPHEPWRRGAPPRRVDRVRTWTGPYVHTRGRGVPYYCSCHAGGGATRLGAARHGRKDYEPALLSTPSAVSVPTRLRARARRAAAGTAGYRGAGERRIAGVTPYVCPPHVPVPPAGVGRGRRRAADTLALPPLRPLRPCVHPPLPSLCR